jgi:hypothetical protein
VHGHHAHPHGHVHGPPDGAAAVLDIGGGIGALVVHLDRSHLGTELFVRSAGHPEAATTHTGVWARTVGGREHVVAVFPELEQGDYDILDPDGTPVQVVTITDGRVTEVADAPARRQIPDAHRAASV